MGDAAITGLEALERKLRAIEAALQPESLRPIVQAAVQPMLADARDHVHVSSGETKRALTSTSSANSNGAAASVVVPDSGPGGAHHEAVFLEYGTRRSAAAPFMRPAFFRQRGAALRIVETGVADAIQKQTD